jgi:folate-binding protein YgfZ
MDPLHDLHRQAEAEFQAYGDGEIVSTFGEVPAEYAAIRKGCALMDLGHRGLLELSGKDRLPFLNNLFTNQTYDKQTKTGLAPGKGVYAFLLDAKSGRIISDMNLIERGDVTLLEMDRRMVEPVRAAMDKYLFAEQVKLTDRSDSLHEIALHGPGAPDVVREVGLPDTDALGPHDSVASEGAIAWRDDVTGTPGYHLIVPAEIARKTWMQLIALPGGDDRISRRRVRPIGWAAFNAARIEAGRPLFGIDFDQTILPHETGPLLNRAVSFTKGCYPGQEIVARMHARQQMARRICGIRMNDDALPVAGTKILDDKGNEIGGVTSSTISPVLSNAAIAIALLKRPHFTVGTTLQVPAEGAMRTAKVVEMPFYQPLPQNV